MRILGYVFYRYLWISFNTLLFYFYRFSPRRHTSGMERIPTDRPVIFCSNHPNAFMDALMLGSAVKRRTWFLARSDVFRKKALAKFLSFIGIIPIYRLLEGAENLSKNDETFDKCSAMLEENKAILIFSEGLCVQERRLRKLKKGTARIALGSEAKNNFNLNLTIIPAGINYSSTPWKFRKPLYISLGEPFAVKDYEALYRESPARAMNQFTRDLEDRMREQLVIIEHKENDELVAQLEEMFMRKWTVEKYGDPRNQADTYHTSKAIAHFVNETTKREPEKIAALRDKAQTYFSKLEELRLRDWLVTDTKRTGGIIAGVLLALLTLPFWLFGVITNYVPYKIPWLIQKKIVKNIEWSASVNGTIAVYLWQFYWLLQSLVVALVFRNWYVLGAFMIAVPACGMIAQWNSVRLKKLFGRIRYSNLPANERKDLAEMRSEIEREGEELKGLKV
ncbi:MAG TPA: 1-acyl-sn-glycerol-3-phosphate acyltransferase [Bacteroidia bacterium]|nr:1-acyl-sn-glycerol-3-phosphate acyltransferase [Bacteroidia bacterium]